MSGKRTILLVDMNSFFASVHQAVNPRLRDKAVIVCGDPAVRHGIVLAASYPAKAFGIKTGMAVGEARAYCPQGIFIRPDYDLYMDFSIRTVEVMRDFSPLVEVFSIDEAFIDVTGCENLFGDGISIARSIKGRIREEIGLTCSIGIGNCKVVAKTAADLQKPDGLTVIMSEEIPQKYWPLPLEKMFGVGSRLKKTLHDFFAVNTIGDLAQCDLRKLRRRFGINGEVLWLCAHGLDSSPVDPHSLEESKSIGHQITLPRDYYRRPEIDTVLLELADEVCSRARAKNYRGRVVGLSIRGQDMLGIYRTKALLQYTDLPSDVFQMAAFLFEEHWPAYRPVRLLGITLGQLARSAPVQLELFTARNQEQRLVKAIDAIHHRHGAKSLMRAISFTEGSIFYEPGEQALGGTSHVAARIPHPSFDVGSRKKVQSPS
ncbi:MAG: DNA polymerase IV [Bacillota bacterium]